MTVAILASKAKMTQRSSTLAALALLIGLSAIMHWSWIIKPGIFTALDWRFRWPETMQEDFSAPTVLLGNEYLTPGLRMPPAYPLALARGAIAHLGLGFTAWSKIFFLWPITFLGPLPIFFLLRLLFQKNNQAAIIGSLIYIGNPYILGSELTHLNIAVGYLLAPWLLFTTHQLLERPRWSTSLLTTLAWTISITYETRLVYIMAPVAAAYALHQLITRRIRWRKHLPLWLILTAIFIISLQTYWLLPFIFARQSFAYDSIVSRSVIPGFSTITHGLTLFHPFWEELQRVPFTQNQPPLIFWLLPLFAFANFLYWPYRRVYPKVSPIFWVVVAGISILLVANEHWLLSKIYTWLWQTIPGFSLFRESSKFYLPITLAYSILIPQAIMTLHHWPEAQSAKVARHAYAGAILGLTLIGLFSLRPMILTTAGQLLIPRAIPTDYEKLKSLLTSDSNFGRSLWVPESHRFGFFSQTHPRLWLLNLALNEWHEYLPQWNDATSLLSAPYFPSLLNFASVSHVIVPSDPDHEIFKSDAIPPRSTFTQLISNLPNLIPLPLTEIADRPSTLVWKNPTAKPRLYFSTDTILLAGNLRDFSEDDSSLTSAFLFQDDLAPEQHPVALAATNTAEITPYTPPYLQTQPERIDSIIPLSPNTPYLLNLTDTSTVTYQLNAQRRGDQIIISAHPILPQALSTATSSTEIFSFPISLTTNALTINQTFYLLPQSVYESDHLTPLGLWQPKGAQLNYTLFSHLPDNLIDNGSFETHTWGPAQDCNNSDNSEPITNGITATIVPQATAGNNSLRLTAGNHLACSRQRLTLTDTTALYQLDLDYWTESGPAPFARLHYQSADTPQQQFHLARDNRWRSFQDRFSITDGGDYQLILNQPSDPSSSTQGSTLFDNLKLTKYQPLQTGQATWTNPSFATSTPISSSSDLNLVPLHQPTIVLDHAFTDTHESLVQDCNNSDGSSLADNGIKLTQHKNQPTSPANFISLEAQQHIACLRLNLEPTPPFSTLLVTTEYNFETGAIPLLAISSEDQQYQQILRLPTDTPGQWRRLQNLISLPPNISNIRVHLYVPNNNGSISRANFSHINVSAIATPPEISLTHSQQSQPVPIIQNPTHSLIKHSLTATGLSQPQLLVLSDTYHTGWRAFIRPNQAAPPAWWQKFTLQKPGWELPPTNHLKVNSLTNGWYIDPQLFPLDTSNQTGDYQIVLEFWPQRLMNIGFIISCLSAILLTIAGCRFFLINIRPGR